MLPNINTLRNAVRLIFFGIKDGKYITPKSPSVLPSITNMSLRQIARDMGLTVEERHIPVEELDSFEECGACGTAAVISPIGYIYDMQTEKSYNYGEEVGKNCMELLYAFAGYSVRPCGR